MTKKKRAGMTMMVLIVIAVLAVISAAVVPMLGAYIENSRYATAESDLDSIMTAIGAAYLLLMQGEAPRLKAQQQRQTVVVEAKEDILKAVV